MVFDALNPTTGVNTVFAANLLTGDLVQVATTSVLSYPTYTGDDRAVVFSEADGSAASLVSLDIQPLATDRLTPLGSRTRWLTDGYAPAVYRRGTWDGTLKDPADCAEAASADLNLALIDALEGSYTPGSEITVFSKVQNTSGVASGDFSISYHASTDTIIEPGDPLLGTLELTSLGPADELAGSVKYPFPNELNDGMYYIGAILNISDSAAGNNINHDPVTVRVSSDSNMQVRPLTLDFTGEAPRAAAANIDSDRLFAAYKLNHRFQNNLVVKVKRDGSVRVIVGLETGFRPEGTMPANERLDQRRGIQTLGDQLLSSLQGLNFKENARYRYIPFMALTVDEEALEQLFRSPLVSSIGEDTLAAPAMATSNQVIGSPLAWAEGYDGSGQTVAILDTGVDKTHPWFTSGGQKVVSEACYSSNDPGQAATSLCPGGVESSTAPGSGVNCEGLCNHGTHVAGIAAGNDGAGPGFGVGRGADLIAIQVFTRIDNQETCGGQAQCVLTFSSDQISALERVFALRDSHDIAAVNMSLGGGQYFDQATCDAENGSVKAAIDNLRSVGIATVIATGNDGFTDSIGAPACISTAISVGNTRRNDEVSASSDIYPQIHLLAPGTDIISSIPGTGTEALTGTSMAAPHVAGAWAVMKQVFPDDSVSDILSKFQSTATMVNDSRLGGIESNMPRINLDLAIGGPRTTFGIFNKGPAILQVSSIEPETPAPWLNWLPAAPFEIPANEMTVLRVVIDYDLAPPGTSQTRLLVNSNDPDDSPEVLVNVTASGVPEPEFDSTPAADETIAFGNVQVLAQSVEQAVTIKNLGGGSLTVTCSLIGTNPADFNITGCPINGLAGGGSEQITISCEPTAAGARSATLRLNTNDADEGTVDFSLSCFGTTGDTIFGDGFES